MLKSGVNVGVFQGEKAKQRIQGGSKAEGISISDKFQEKKSLPVCNSHELPSEC